jgi:hypothetical protein
MVDSDEPGEVMPQQRLADLDQNMLWGGSLVVSLEEHLGFGRSRL